MSGFYDPRFYDSRFPFYDMQQQQQMPLPFVFNGSTSPPVPQNSQQREGASSTKQSLPSTPSPQSSLSSVEEENAEKRKPKSYDKWTHETEGLISLIHVYIKSALARGKVTREMLIFT